jgi:hypothetical protein
MSSLDNIFNSVGLVMSTSIFWDISPFSPLKVSCAYQLLSRWFLPWLILGLWRWRRHFPPKRLLTFSGLHGVISYKIELFIFDSVAVKFILYVSELLFYIKYSETSFVRQRLSRKQWDIILLLSMIVSQLGGAVGLRISNTVLWWLKVNL